MATKINVDTTTNATIQKNLGLSNMAEHHLHIFPTEDLEHYFVEYPLSPKAYRIRDAPDPFFREISKFLLEVGCVHLKTYGMPKQKDSVIISTFEGHDVDWGVIIGIALQEGLHAFETGKKL